MWNKNLEKTVGSITKVHHDEMSILARERQIFLDIGCVCFAFSLIAETHPLYR